VLLAESWHCFRLPRAPIRLASSALNLASLDLRINPPDICRKVSYLRYPASGLRVSGDTSHTNLLHCYAARTQRSHSRYCFVGHNYLITSKATNHPSAYSPSAQSGFSSPTHAAVLPAANHALQLRPRWRLYWICTCRPTALHPTPRTAPRLLRSTRGPTHRSYPHTRTGDLAGTGIDRRLRRSNVPRARTSLTVSI